MSNITDFQQVVEQYAAAIAKERKTKVKWVCLDGTQKHVKEKYPSMKLSYTVNDPVFNWGLPSPSQDLMFKQTLTNKGSERPQTTIKRSEKKSDTFSWSVTEGIKIGQSVTTKAGINIEAISAGVEETSSFEFNLSSTQGSSQTVERSWEVDQSIPQAPHSITEIEWLLDRNKSDGSFTADVLVTGNVAIWFEDKIDLNNPNGKDLHWLWFPSPASVVRKVKPAGFRISGNSVIFRATGNIKADVGLESRLIINEKPIEAAKIAPASAGQILAVTPSYEFVLTPEGKALDTTHESAED